MVDELDGALLARSVMPTVGRAKPGATVGTSDDDLTSSNKKVADDVGDEVGASEESNVASPPQLMIAKAQSKMKNIIIILLQRGYFSIDRTKPKFNGVRYSPDILYSPDDSLIKVFIEIFTKLD
jgi:hypothetical protein